MERLRSTLLLAALLLAGAMAAPALADALDADPPTQAQTWALHGQTTLVEQATPAFRSPYQGPNSLDPKGEGRETFDATVYAGFRPWAGAEIWVNQEVDQGFGVSGTLGVAGFPSGEAYKIGMRDPYLRLQRAFLRQSIELGGARSNVDAAANQLGGTQTENRLVFTVGKFSVVDVFDANKNAHDPRGDFVNWSVIDTGTFDYAADAWGYSEGGAAELYQGDWTVRGGVFDLSIIPNNATLDSTFGQFQLVGEIERRFKLAGKDGKLAITGFLSRARMATYADAIAEAHISGGAPGLAGVRQYRSREGVSANLEQQLSDTLSLFARAGVADGSVEPYEFADIDRTFALGLSMTGDRWGRKDDTVGLAGVVNGISKIHEEFLDDGGRGILIGDGKLPHPGPEEIVEAYYQFGITRAVALTFDVQMIANPAYNTDRGPAPVFGARLHGQF
jgi:high affinity Mn2+ porin